MKCGLIESVQTVDRACESVGRVYNLGSGPLGFIQRLCRVIFVNKSIPRFVSVSALSCALSCLDLVFSSIKLCFKIIPIWLDKIKAGAVGLRAGLESVFEVGCSSLYLRLRSAVSCCLSRCICRFQRAPGLRRVKLFICIKSFFCGNLSFKLCGIDKRIKRSLKLSCSFVYHGLLLGGGTYCSRLCESSRHCVPGDGRELCFLTCIDLFLRLVNESVKLVQIVKPVDSASQSVLCIGYNLLAQAFECIVTLSNCI